jgi:hypothetical protein
LDKRRSTSGYVFTLAGGPVSWMSKLQNIVSLSTMEEEYIASSHACKEEIWLKGLLGEFGRMQDKVKLFCDSQSVIHLAKNPAYHSKTNHIPIKYHFVRQVIDEGGVALEKVPYKRKLCRHVHETSIVREVAMVLGFSWLAGKVMNKFGHDISGKLLSRWILLKQCQPISHILGYELLPLLRRLCIHI